MCGISGIISKNQINKSELIQSVEVLAHRGPDGNGSYTSPNKQIGFGHSRLSFIELSDFGRQPFCNEDESIIITFNGEVYNFEALKEELEKEGIAFKTKTDTEVILQAYAFWGKSMLSKLKGMFAFAILDVKRKKVFMARDRFGIKPFYYTCQNEAFVFGSEIKALLRFSTVKKEVRRESVACFLANRYVPSPYTIWENIKQLPPAHFLELDTETLAIKIESYWKLGFNQSHGNQEVIEQEIKSIFQNSVQQHLISDVQVGSFLSGGMDSSLLVLTMKELDYKPIDAFTIGFENWEQSEHFYARKVAEHLDIALSEEVEESFTLDSVQKLMVFYDNPIADISILPTYSVSKLARTKVKAVLSGEGADECFGGYWWQQPQNFKFKNTLEKWKARFLGVSFQQIKNHYIEANSMGLFDSHELKKAFTEEWQSAIPIDPFAHLNQFERKGISTLKQIQYLDLNLFMPELVLAKIDRATMANSLEARVPFLDHELVEKVFSLKEEIYFDRNIQKKVLRNMLKDNVPAEVYDRKKQGFVGPDQFYENFKVYQEKLMSGRLVREDIINSNYIQTLIDTKDHWRLWKLFVLDNWWEVWV